MKLDATDRKRLTDVISEVPQTMSVGVTVTFRDRRPIDDGWEIAELQDEVSAACAGTDDEKVDKFVEPVSRIHSA